MTITHARRDWIMPHQEDLRVGIKMYDFTEDKQLNMNKLELTNTKSQIKLKSEISLDCLLSQ